MVFGLLLFLSLVLFELFRLLRMGANAKTIIARSQEAMRVLRSPQLADDAKESFMRRGSIEILKATLQLAAKFVLTVGILFALFQLFVAIFPDLRQPLLESLVSPSVITILTAAVVGYAWARKAALRRLQVLRSH
jgi:hypothetical protein